MLCRLPEKHQNLLPLHFDFKLSSRIFHLQQTNPLHVQNLLIIMLYIGWLVFLLISFFVLFQVCFTQFLRSSDLKRETNSKFRRSFPTIRITLSKLKSLKRDILKIGHEEVCKNIFYMKSAVE